MLQLLLTLAGGAAARARPGFRSGVLSRGPMGPCAYQLAMVRTCVTACMVAEVHAACLVARAGGERGCGLVWWPACGWVWASQLGVTAGRSWVLCMRRLWQVWGPSGWAVLDGRADCTDTREGQVPGDMGAPLAQASCAHKRVSYAPLDVRLPAASVLPTCCLCRAACGDLGVPAGGLAGWLACVCPVRSLLACCVTALLPA